MGKKKETFFERLVKKNAEQENQNVKATKPKNKRWKIILTSSILIVTIGTGITVPLVINSVKKNYLDPYAKTDNLINTDYDGSKLNVNVGEFESIYKNQTNNDVEAKLNEIDKVILFYLYDKEQKASEEYQKIWNETKNADAQDVKTFRLSTIDELTTKFKNEILDVQNNMKQQYGTENWETEFNKYLYTTFNKAKSIDEAVDYRVFQSIKSDALRRYRLTSGNKKEEIDRKFKDGKAAFPWWNGKEGTAYWKVDNDDLAVTTESYVFEDSYKLPTPFIKNFVEEDKPVVISEFVFPGIAPSDAKGKWTINKDIFFRFLFYAKTETFNIPKDGNPKSTIELVKESFKPFDYYIKLIVDEKPSNGVYIINKEASAYSSILSLLSNDPANVKSNWGTSGVSTISEILDSNNLNTFLAMNPEIMGANSIKEIDLFGKLEEIKQNVAKAAGLETKDIDSNEKANKFNTDIWNYVKKDVNETTKAGLIEEKFNDLVVKPISELFTPEDKKLNLVYKIKGLNDVYGIFTNDGFKMMYLQNSTKTPITSESVISMIKNDFIIKKKFDKQTGVQYNALSKINKTISRDQYIVEMLEDPAFLDYLKKQKNPLAVVKNGDSENYDDAWIDKLKKYANKALKYSKQSKFVSLTTGAKNWLEGKAKSEFVNGFEIKEGKTYFKGNNTKTAFNTLVEYMKNKYFNK